jgi:diguanylate cyclase (GGDEF)-like protein
MVDLRSLTAEMSAKRTIFSLVDRPQDQDALKRLMEEVAAGDSVVQSRFMHIGGKEMLVGIGYLDRLGWFNVTLMDIDAIIDRRLFLPIGLLLAAVMGLVTALMVLVFKRQVLDRLKRLERVVQSARQGDYGPALSMGDGRNDEVGRLSAAFTEMAVAVTDHTRLLEARVRERTEALETLASRDGQTGIANRRGFVAAYAEATPGHQRGLLLVDIDHFKSINDNFGHAAGDAVIIAVASRLVQCIGPGNVCARWGGDEFIVLLQDSAPHLLSAVAYGIMAAISDVAVDLPGRGLAMVTVSVGACLVEPGDTIEMVTEMADAALYMAKGQGRNRVVIFDPASAQTEAGRAARPH